MVRKYESCFLFKSEEPEYKATLEEVNAHLTNFKAANVSLNSSIGERALEYPILKQARGRYEIIEFEIDSNNLKELEVQLKLVKNLLRYMILVKVTKKINLKKIKKRSFRDQRDMSQNRDSLSKDENEVREE